MTNVITYGTFDLLHDGHVRLLRRARALGDHLTVGVTSESYDAGRGKLNVHDSLTDRIEAVRETGLADRIIVEEYAGQKVDDMQRYDIDVFAIGSDWRGRFDYLNEFCDVVYLERTPGVSSTSLRAESVRAPRLGIVGAGRIANRFVTESRFVSGVDVDSVYARREAKADEFARAHSLGFATSSYRELLEAVDAVYVATPHETHFEFVERAILAGKHVLCEKPMTLRPGSTEDLYRLAAEHDVVLVEAVKTAFMPGFLRLCAIAKSGVIGEVRGVDATFTKLVPPGSRETRPGAGAGSLAELGSYPLLAIGRILGTEPLSASRESVLDEAGDYDELSRLTLRYPRAIGSATVGLGAKTEGDLRVAGTHGYLYVPSPWWLTSHFEVRGPDGETVARHADSLEGDGLRYELAAFEHMIRTGERETYKLTPKLSEFIQRMIAMSPTIDDVHSF